MASDLENLKNQIINALNHTEAEDGLFFQNFIIVHESEDRQPVMTNDAGLIYALEDLVKDEKVSMGVMDGKVIFKIKK
jgi:hypothetical protein